MLQSSSEFWRHWHICKKWILKQSGFVELNMKRNNAISTEFLVLFIFIWSSIQISTNMCFTYQRYQVFNFCCVTEYSSAFVWLWVVPAKPEVLHKESGKLHWRATYLVCACHLYRVFFQTVFWNRVATPAGFRLARMQNHNKVIYASWGKGVNKMTESKYSLTHSVHPCVPFLFPVQQLLLDSQPLTDPTVPHGSTGKVW